MNDRGFYDNHYGDAIVLFSDNAIALPFPTLSAISVPHRPHKKSPIVLPEEKCNLAQVPHVNPA